MIIFSLPSRRVAAEDAAGDDLLLGGEDVEAARVAEPAAKGVATDPAVAERLERREDALVKKAAIVDEKRKQAAVKKAATVAAKRAEAAEPEADWAALLVERVGQVCFQCWLSSGTLHLHSTLYITFFAVAGWRRDKGEGASAKEEATTAGTCFFQDVMQFLLLKMN